jgi:excinuclease ABC subunit C
MIREDDQDERPDDARADDTDALSAQDDAAECVLEATADLARGVGVIKGHLRTLPDRPGVYRMLNGKGDALYVGKAKSLRKRVAAYIRPFRLPVRLQRMIAQTMAMEFVTTHTEAEALLLESNLIKRLAPRYNVLLRDDKSFPHILITTPDPAGPAPAPQLRKHRGTRTEPGHYFGPFASALAVNNVMTALQRAFQLRTCSDAVYAGRARPCLQYQIKRCTAPCVGRASAADYARQADDAMAFLRGRSSDIQASLAHDMHAAAAALDFERAAKLRDRIKALTAIQGRQDINIEGMDDADIIAAHQEAGATCVQVFFFRGGRNYGNRAYFPAHDKSLEAAEVLGAFVAQFYDARQPPPSLLLSHEPPEVALLQAALSLRLGGRVDIHLPKRGDKRRALDHAVANAKEALGRRLAESGSQARLLAGTAEIFGLPAPPRRIEVYDNSHIQGTAAIGAMIVAGSEGFVRNAYRQFNIRSVKSAGDDYAMMREVLTRRFGRSLRERDTQQETAVQTDDMHDVHDASWPDLLLIDGGEGQLAAAIGALRDLGITNLAVVAIAKGPDRDAGRERFFMPDRPPFTLDPKNPTLYFLQRLRDEAHRFAISTHRTLRVKQAKRSLLDDAPGVGAKRKKALLAHFGSAKAASQAALADLEAVPGISKVTARQIYDYFRAPG